MKIVHIGADDSGGAGIGMMRLHQSLCRLGCDSKVLVKIKNGNDPKTFQAEVSGGAFLRNFIPAVLNKSHLYESLRYRNERIRCEMREKLGLFFTNQFSLYDELDRHPLVREADVVHLHWVAGFVDLPSFSRKIAKPVVWTIRDENPVLGGFHFKSDIPEFIPPEVLEFDKKLKRIKERELQRISSLAFVSLSSGMDALLAESPIAKGRKRFVIPNSVDGHAFMPIDKNEARGYLGIPSGALVLVFIAQLIDDKRKGLKELFDALDKARQLKDAIVLCVGGQKADLPPHSCEVRALGFVSDAAQLSRIFSAGDFYVNPSFAESFGKTTTEALACGLPVIAFANYGSLDIIGEGDGLIAEAMTSASLTQALCRGLEMQFSPSEIRARALRRFAPEKVAESYLSVYEEIMDGC